MLYFGITDYVKFLADLGTTSSLHNAKKTCPRTSPCFTPHGLELLFEPHDIAINTALFLGHVFVLLAVLLAVLLVEVDTYYAAIIALPMSMYFMDSSLARDAN